MIKAIVVDDERNSAEGMKCMLLESGKVEVLDCFNRTCDANEYLKKNQVDAIFIDIEIPDMNGFEFANIIKGKPSLNDKCAIIFVTAHEEYAVEAFKIKALDYLLKPVSEKRLENTLKRIENELYNIKLARRVYIKCFGKFTIKVNNKEIKFRKKKAEELIALLIDQYGNEVSRNTIIDYLWKDSDGDKAIISFNTTLHYARKVLATYGVENPIINENGICKIEFNDFCCDYLDLMNCEFTDKSINDENVEEYEKVAALYTGGYFENDDFIWAEENRLNAKEKYLRLVIALSRYYRRNDKINKIIDVTKSAFWISPEDNIIAKTLIEALIEIGMYSLAVRYYKLHSAEIMKVFHRTPDANLSQLLFATDSPDE